MPQRPLGVKVKVKWGGKGGGGKGKAQSGKAAAIPGLPPSRAPRRQRSTADWVCALCVDADGYVYHINEGKEQWCTRCLRHKGTDHAFGGRVCDQVRMLEERELAESGGQPSGEARLSPDSAWNTPLQQMSPPVGASGG